MNRIVVRKTSRYMSTWVCEDCRQPGTGLSGGPAPINLKYAQEKHRCRPDWEIKWRECGR